MLRNTTFSLFKDFGRNLGFLFWLNIKLFYNNILWIRYRNRIMNDRLIFPTIENDYILSLVDKTLASCLKLYFPFSPTNVGFQLWKFYVLDEDLFIVDCLDPPCLYCQGYCAF